MLRNGTDIARTQESSRFAESRKSKFAMKAQVKYEESDSDGELTSDSAYEIARSNDAVKEYRCVLSSIPFAGSEAMSALINFSLFHSEKHGRLGILPLRVYSVLPASQPSQSTATDQQKRSRKTSLDLHLKRHRPEATFSLCGTLAGMKYVASTLAKNHSVQAVLSNLLRQRRLPCANRV